MSELPNFWLGCWIILKAIFSVMYIWSQPIFWLLMAYCLYTDRVCITIELYPK